MNPNLTAPKILPWVARKAGISDELALKLWRRAVSEAEFLTGQTGGSQYCRLAVERFLALVEDETEATPQYTANPAPRLAWVWHHQTRLSLLSLIAARNTCRYWQSAWERIQDQYKIAA
ncbi:MAG: hypothetical protein LBE62_09050 [Azonexus sp.]|jgi:hypothetical protein|nr:hypothetical protein [Azonexus sp.]